MKFEPTYRLEPQIDFYVEYVRNMLRILLEEKFREYKTYQAKKINRDCQRICIDALTQVKEMNPDRYRIIVCVNAGEKFYQGINYATAFLWDRERDKWASYVFEAQDFYVCATVYGIYFD